MIKKTGRVYICPTMLAQTQFPVLHMVVQQKEMGVLLSSGEKGKVKANWSLLPVMHQIWLKNSSFGGSVVFRSL